MDPLHPLVPIEPPAPTPPKYNRVERIDRDPQGDSGPDWQGEHGHGSDEEEPEQQFEDDYDPDWSDPAAVEPYGPDGAVHEGAVHDTVDLSSERDMRAEHERELESEHRWDPHVDGERRAHPRDQDGSGDDDDAGPEPPQHIDISA
jgi:hypothetical protein